MKYVTILLIFISSFVVSDSCAQFENVIGSHPIKIGEAVKVESKFLNEDRELNIYLPLRYHPDSLITYPVIYLLDGSMDEDFLHIVGLTQFHSYSWIKNIPQCIVVGISNVNRYRDFTFEPQNKEYLESDPRRGGSAAFMDFLEFEVQPFVQSAYKVNDEKIIIGQSLGGLLATEIFLKRPSMFNHYIIISPSLWYDDKALLDVDFSEKYLPKSVFIGVGKEGKIMVNSAKQLYRRMIKKYGKKVIKFNYFPQHDHGDVLHNAVNNAFEKIGMNFFNTTK